jgi:hypothetical protein
MHPGSALVAEPGAGRIPVRRPDDHMDESSLTRASHGARNLASKEKVG